MNSKYPYRKFFTLSEQVLFQEDDPDQVFMAVVLSPNNMVVYFETERDDSKFVSCTDGYSEVSLNNLVNDGDWKIIDDTDPRIADSVRNVLCEMK